MTTVDKSGSGSGTTPKSPSTEQKKKHHHRKAPTSGSGKTSIYEPPGGHVSRHKKKDRNVTRDGTRDVTRDISRDSKHKDKKKFNVHHAQDFVQMTFTKGVAGIQEVFKKYPRKSAYPLDRCTVFAAHPEKNRYKDVGCLDATRVKLMNGDDYIHANFVDTETSPKRFICAQGPMENTVADFWSMIAENRVEVIIMLCNFVEQDTKKCEVYFPEKVGDSMVFGDLRITKTRGEPLKFKEHIVKVVCTVLEVHKGNDLILTTRHYHWVDWPDRGVPPADLAVIAFLQSVSTTTAPILCHCSAGVGRTGSIVLLQMVLELMAAGKPYSDLEPIMLQLREQRPGSVQTDQQYLYVHQILLQYFHSRDKVFDKSLEKLQKKFSEDYVKATV